MNAIMRVQIDKITLRVKSQRNLKLIDSVASYVIEL